MPRPLLFAAFAVFLPLVSATLRAGQPHTLQSPDDRLRLTAELSEEGRLRFSLAHDEIALVTGQLGLKLKEGGPLKAGFKISETTTGEHDKVYTIPVGKTSQARNHYRELAVTLVEKEDPGRTLVIRFRAFNDGLAFRYELPEQDGLSSFTLMNELTRFHFTRDPTAYVLPLGSYTSNYERYYEPQPVSQIRDDAVVGLPLLLEHPEHRWLAITEANLVDYAGMYLGGGQREGSLITHLSPLPGRENGAKVLGQTPFVSPWRIIMVAEEPGQLIESNIVFNLSTPCQIEDTSWIKPGKTTFPWWNGWAHEDVDFEWGLNTATTKYYIDFCAAHGIPYHSLDGTDKAWYGGPIRPTGPTDITTARPQLDLQEVIRYAEEKGVRLRLWMHWKALKPQIDEAFAQYEEWGIEGVMVDFMDRDDQEMVNFYYEMARKAAKHHLTLTLHGAYKPTGMTRTWPNVLTYEAVLNQEYNKWDPRGTPPRHNINVAFTRMLAGPLDYHQGGMRNVLPADYHPRNDAPLVQGTRGHQLAMYIVYQNHLPMLADFPAAYEVEAGFAFLVDVPCNWDETRVLHATMGECIVIARRAGETWYVGGMAAEEAKELAIPLDFLEAGNYEYRLLCDDPAGDPRNLKISEGRISAAETARISIPTAGGFVATLRPQ